MRLDFDAILRFWMDRGFAGFRIDVANGLVKDRELRDNPPVADDDHALVRRLGLRPVHNMNRPEVHDVLRRWRSIVDAHEPPGVLLGETWVGGSPLVGGVLRIRIRRAASSDEHPLRLLGALGRDATDRRIDGGRAPPRRVAVVARIQP